MKLLPESPGQGPIRGTTLLVVAVNQQSSLEATEIAKQALARL